jgi:3-oxoacyl-[acyl-carrier-protein] synthase II
MVMEELGHALKRNAKIYAEVSGYYSTLDSFHMVQPAPDAESGSICAERAIKDAGIYPEEIDYINAHGTSTPFNDKNETNVVKKVFRERAYKIPISANKSMTGHTLGAAGAIEAIASLLTLNYQYIPPTINYTSPDPECDLDYVPNQGREAEVHTILSSSYGFGGKNSAIIFKHFLQ